MRDLEKDKALCEGAMSGSWLAEIGRHYIAQYEAAQARIRELEALLHPNNRPDVVTRQEHDRALERIFREIKGDDHVKSMNNGPILLIEEDE